MNHHELVAKSHLPITGAYLIRDAVWWVPLGGERIVMLRSSSTQKQLGHGSPRGSPERIPGLVRQSGTRTGSHLHPGTKSIQPCTCAGADRVPIRRSHCQWRPARAFDWHYFDLEKRGCPKLAPPSSSPSCLDNRNGSQWAQWLGGAIISSTWGIVRPADAQCAYSARLDWRTIHSDNRRTSRDLAVVI
jgi:hypothetical protein